MSLEIDKDEPEEPLEGEEENTAPCQHWWCRFIPV